MNEEDVTREQLIADLGFLNETAMEFLRHGPEQDIYQYIVERLTYITGDCWVAISTFHPERESTCLRALTGPSDLRGKILEMLGEKPGECYRKISDEARRHLLTGRLHKVEGGMYEVLFGHVPLALAKAIERIASIGEIYSMGCVSQGQLFGAVLIMLRASRRLPRPQVVEAFINQASVALQRNQAEERLRHSQRVSPSVP
jgi:hypothetical protein